MKKICTLEDGTNTNGMLELCGKCANDMETSVGKIKSLIDWLDQFFDDEYKIKTMNVFAAYDRLEKCCDNLVGLEEWIDFRTVKKKCEKVGSV